MISSNKALEKIKVVKLDLQRALGTVSYLEKELEERVRMNEKR